MKEVSIMKRFFRLLPLILILSLLISSCSSRESGIVGSWKITRCIVDGVELEDLNECIFLFREDGTGVKTILGEEEFSFSYSYDGTSCILFNLIYPDGETESGSYAEIKVRGNTMTVSATEDGSVETVTLKRQKNRS